MKNTVKKGRKEENPGCASGTLSTSIKANNLKQTLTMPHQILLIIHDTNIVLGKVLDRLVCYFP
jgi:hypothetical protein